MYRQFLLQTVLSLGLIVLAVAAIAILIFLLVRKARSKS